MRLLIVMLLLQLTWAASGWTIEDAQEKSLARYFTNVSLAIQHWEIYPGATLVDERQKEKAIRQLMVFINAEPKAPATATNRPPQINALQEVRPRDYWTCVLSRLAGIEFHLTVAESPGERDQKIDKLLEQVATAHKKSSDRVQKGVRTALAR